MMSKQTVLLALAGALSSIGPALGLASDRMGFRIAGAILSGLATAFGILAKPPGRAKDKKLELPT
jgi:hypothetical protein